MDLKPRTAPDSQLWWQQLSNSPSLAGVRVALLSSEPDAEVRSLADVLERVRDFLVPLMRDGSGKPLPTSLCVSGHAKRSELCYDGKESGSVRKLLRDVRDALPPDLRPFLCHVHVCACESLKVGVQPPSGMTVSGYTVSVDVESVRVLYQFVVAAVEEAAAWTPDADPAQTAQAIRIEIERRMVQLRDATAEMVSGLSLAESATHMRVLNPLTRHTGVTCDECDMTPLTGVRFKHKDKNDDRCYRCYKALPKGEHKNYTLWAGA
jgi:hypothetical protein